MIYAKLCKSMSNYLKLCQYVINLCKMSDTYLLGHSLAQFYTVKHTYARFSTKIISTRKNIRLNKFSLIFYGWTTSNDRPQST